MLKTDNLQPYINIKVIESSDTPNISIDKAWPGRYILNIKVTSTSDKLDATYFDCYNFMTCTSLKTIVCIDNCGVWR